MLGYVEEELALCDFVGLGRGIGEDGELDRHGDEGERPSDR
jgi:hypothetical protein